MPKCKKSVYLDETSNRLLTELATRTGQTNSQIVDNALWLSANIKELITAQMTAAITLALNGRDAHIRQIVGEEMLNVYQEHIIKMMREEWDKRSK
jgi:hypothetical protein